MLFRLKNDDGIELHLSSTERALLFDALRHYSAYDVMRLGTIREFLRVLEVKEPKENGTDKKD